MSEGRTAFELALRIDDLCRDHEVSVQLAALIHVTAAIIAKQFPGDLNGALKLAIRQMREDAHQAMGNG